MAKHIAYEFFRDYYKGSDAVEQRGELLKRIASKRGDTSDMTRILNDALDGDDEDELVALDKLFSLLSELTIAARIQRRLVDLASRSGEADGENSTKLATRLNNLAFVLHDLGEFEEAKPLYERAIAIGEKNARSRAPGLGDSAQQLRGAAESPSAFSLRDRASNHRSLPPAGGSRERKAALRTRDRYHRENAWPRAPRSREMAQQLRGAAESPSAFSLRDRASNHRSLPPAGGSRERKAALRTRDRYHRENAWPRAPRSREMAQQLSSVAERPSAFSSARSSLESPLSSARRGISRAQSRSTNARSLSPRKRLAPSTPISRNGSTT